MAHIDIVMSKAPGPDSEFIEAEDETGAGVNAGDWIDRQDGTWALRIPMPTVSDEDKMLCPHGVVLCYRCIQDAVVDAMAAGVLPRA